MHAIRLLPVLMTVPAACASPAAPAAPAALKIDTQTETVTPGTWSYRQDDRGSIALFGAPGHDAMFTIRCDVRARRVFVSVIGTAPGTLTLQAMTAQKVVGVAPTGGHPSYLASEISAFDPILDALAYSRGHFDVVLGTTRLAIPAWPEFARPVEDCRG